GDDGQCLLAGTSVTMADGSRRPIEDISPGDEVLSCYGSGEFRAARVSDVFCTSRSDLVRIVTRGRREIVSTPEHTHFAGYRNGLTPKLSMTYVMRKQGVGCRVGTTRTLVNARGQSVAGIQARAMKEQADAAWVISTHSTDAEARAAEAVLSVTYGLPTVPFTARPVRGLL